MNETKSQRAPWRGIALGIALALGVTAAAPALALAHGNIWMDENVAENERVTKYKKDRKSVV